MPTYRAVGFLRHCCPWGQVRYNASATDLAARSIATQTRCFGKLQATAGNLAVVLFLGYGSRRQARLSDEATRHAPPSAARPDSSRPRTAGAIQPPECARLATCRRAFSFDLARPCTTLSVCPSVHFAQNGHRRTQLEIAQTSNRTGRHSLSGIPLALPSRSARHPDRHRGADMPMARGPTVRGSTESRRSRRADGAAVKRTN